MVYLVIQIGNLEFCSAESWCVSLSKVSSAARVHAEEFRQIKSEEMTGSKRYSKMWHIKMPWGPPGSCGVGDAGSLSSRIHPAEVLGNLISKEHCLGLQITPMCMAWVRSSGFKPGATSTWGLSSSVAPCSVFGLQNTGGREVLLLFAVSCGCSTGEWVLVPIGRRGSSAGLSHSWQRPELWQTPDPLGRAESHCKGVV